MSQLHIYIVQITLLELELRIFGYFNLVLKFQLLLKERVNCDVNSVVALF